ncbi:MAG TPA: hypothetical protein DD471_16205 [Planctomycetes bacterium]|nr:hypothetical protein [Planctomycetota bacterium]
MRLARIPITFFLLLLTGSLLALDDAAEAEVLLEKAAYLESIDGNPREALRLYRGIRKTGLPAQTIARTLLGEATCLDALGQDEPARRKFLELLARYPGQSELAEVAREYLSSRLWDTPASYMPEKMLFYAEMVKPGNELIRLSSSIRGTPFENSVDSSRTLAVEAQEDGPAQIPGTGSTGWISAFLSKAMFRELSKMGGVALGVPAKGDPEKDYLAVLSAGKSDALSGYITSILSLAKKKARVVGFIQDMPLYEVEEVDENYFLAAGEKVVVLGRPRQLVEEAVKRRSARSMSLATNSDFVNAWSKKKDSLMFFFIDGGYPFSAGLGFKETANAFNLAEIGPVSLAISTVPDTDTLHATMWTARNPLAKDDLLGRLATDPIDPELIRSIPSESLGFFAFSSKDLRKKLSDIITGFEELPGSQISPLNKNLRAAMAWLLQKKPFSLLIDQIRSVVIGSYPNAALLKISSSVKELGNLSALQIYRPLYFVALQFKDPAAGEKALRDAIEKYSSSLPGASESLSFLREPLEKKQGSPTHHFLQPLPGIRPGYIRIKDQFIVALSPAILKAAVRSRSVEGRNRLPLPAAEASKVFYLRPKPIFSALSVLQKSVPILALKNMKSAVLSTREEKDALAIDLTISDLLPTLNGFLKDLAENLDEEDDITSGK